MAVASFLKLTDTNEVRGVIGVDDKELTDPDICGAKPEDDLKSALLGWVPTYETLMSEGLATSPTAAQTLKYLKLKLYSKYFVSALIVSSGINSLLQKKSDGANEGARFTNLSLRDFQTELENKAKAYKAELLLLIDSSTAATHSHFGIASPNYDPVTNT